MRTRGMKAIIGMVALAALALAAMLKAQPTR